MSENEKNMPQAAEEEEDYTPDLIALLDENNQEHTFEILDVLQHSDHNYYAMVPYEEDPVKRLQQDAEMIIMRLETNEKGEEYLDILQDEDELNSVAQLFKVRLSELYDIDVDEL